METLVQLIFIIALTEYGLKASRSLQTLLLYATFIGIWGVIWYPWVINLPVTIAGQLLGNKEIVNTGAVLTTIEAVAGITISIKMLDDHFSSKQKQNRWVRTLKTVPGLLVLAAIPYFELLFFKMRLVDDFLTGSVVYALSVTLGMFALGLFFRTGVREPAQQLELKFLLNLAVLLGGLLINSSVAEYNISRASTEVEWSALLTMLLLTGCCILIGLMTRKLKIAQLLKLHR